MSEEVVTFGNSRSLVGILHCPEEEAARRDVPAVLMLNAGILHRVGPNRLYVTIARELERRGFHVLRFDVWGIGDSQDHLSAGESGTFFDDTLEAMEMLQRCIGASRFMLMGICMGAKIALEVASRDSRVESLVLMEGIYVKSARYHLTRILDPEKWRRVFTGESQMVKKARKRLLGHSAPSRGPQKTDSPGLFLDESLERRMKAKLDRSIARGAKVLLVFRDGNEIAYNYRLRRTGDDIYAVGLPAGLDVRFVPFADHTFTPLVSQDLLLGVAMRWIERTHPAILRPAMLEAPMAVSL
jgi:pimeloyl-ACP methyl ester carboxylesterase